MTDRTNTPSDSEQSTASQTSGQTSRHKLIKITRFALQHAADRNLAQVAASLTFTTVLGVVPLLAVVLSLFTAFPLFDDFRVALEDFLSTSLMPPAVSANIMDYLNLFAAKASGLTAVGSLALIVTSIMLMRTIDEAFNTIWQVEQQRPMRQRMLVYWAILSLGPILIGASLWASSIMAQQSLNYIEHLPMGIGIMLAVIPLLATGLGFTGLFMGVPNCRVYWKDALIGGFGTALVLGLMRTGFAFYLSRFPSYTIIYGAFATLPIFLLWIYLSWLAVLSGAAIAATLPAIRQQRWNIQHYSGSLFVDAVNVLHCLWRVQGQTPPGMTTVQLGNAALLHPNELHHILHKLQELGYAVPSESAQDERWILACDPRTAELAPLMQAMLINMQQPRLNHYPMLPKALAAALSGQQIRLETLFEYPETLPEMDSIRQNDCTVSMQVSTEETHHA